MKDLANKELINLYETVKEFIKSLETRKEGVKND